MLELSLAAFTASFLLVILAEMGDKTQFVAMSFATCYNPYKVLFAIFLGTLGNFALVIVIGQFLTTIVPIDVISLAASLSFIGFGIWTIRVEKAEGENIKLSRFGIIATVAIAFFIAEFGDKTQLATISLAVQYQNPVSVLIGATLGMLVADGIGIIVGVVLCKHIPQRTIKWFSATIFVIFGLVGVYEVLFVKIGLGYTVLVLLLLIALSVSAIIFLAKKQRQKETSEDSLICKNSGFRKQESK